MSLNFRPPQNKIASYDPGDELLNNLYEILDGEVNNEELVDCIGVDEDDEIVMELVEDALEGRVDTVERAVKRLEELPNKQLFKNLKTVFHERNFQRLPLHLLSEQFIVKLMVETVLYK